MKQQIETLSRLADVRGQKVRELLNRVQYQQTLCQRYRYNIEGLKRLCSSGGSMETSLQRDNQQRYKSTLYRMMDLQHRELATAEQMLARIQRELQAAMRSEKIVHHVIDTKLEQWQQVLARQEQKIQDGLATQTWMQGRTGL